MTIDHLRRAAGVTDEERRADERYRFIIANAELGLLTVRQGYALRVLRAAAEPFAKLGMSGITELSALRDALDEAAEACPDDDAALKPHQLAPGDLVAWLAARAVDHGGALPAQVGWAAGLSAEEVEALLTKGRAVDARWRAEGSER